MSNEDLRTQGPNDPDANDQNSANANESASPAGRASPQASSPDENKNQQDAQVTGFPIWGDPVLIGFIYDDNKMTIKPPLNLAAVQNLSEVSAVAIVLHNRITRLEQMIEGHARGLHDRLNLLETILVKKGLLSPDDAENV